MHGITAKILVQIIRKSNSAKHLASLGFKIALVDRDNQKLLEAVEVIKSTHDIACKSYVADVTNEHESASAYDQILAEFEQPVLLFNNAGIMDWSDFENVDPKSFANVYEVNVIGAFVVMRNSLKTLHQKSPMKSRIINLSSRLGSIDLRGNTRLGGALAYQCSKAALNMLTRQTSLELKPKGISVISMSPGWVKTDMGGEEAKYETSQSVSMILSVIQTLEDEKTGIFIGEDGETIPW